MKSKTEWDLSLLYKSPDDPQIKKDTQMIIDEIDKFAKKYKSKKDYVQDEKALLQALKDFESMEDKVSGMKPFLYFHYRTRINSQDNESQAQINKLDEAFTHAFNKITFFSINLGKIKPAKQKDFLQSKQLGKYRYMLERKFITAKYDLSEKEEKIIALKKIPAMSQWVKGFQKSLNKQTVKHEGKNIPLSKASQIVNDLSTKKRWELFTKMSRKCKSVSDFAETEINAIVMNKKIDDDLRKMKVPYLAKVLDNENTQKEVENLVKVVTDNFHIPHRFYEAKAKLLKLDELTYADRAAKIGEIKKDFSFQTSVDIVRHGLKNAGREFEQKFVEFLQNGQIDVFPKKNKTGGGFCSSSHNNPTYILLNHSNTFHDVLTIGHEMGHAIHSIYSQQNQPVIYEEYSISLAETASTFFESFVFDEVVKDLSEKEKVIALHDKLQSDIQSIFRQVACFNFEKELHSTIREKGAMSAQEIAQLMNKHMKAYLGPRFKLKDLDGYFFVQWAHIRTFFYVYTYAYGELVTKVMYTKFNENNKFMSQIKKILSAGSSDTPANILLDIGIDVKNPNFFRNGLKEIEKNIQELEKLI